MAVTQTTTKFIRMTAASDAYTDDLVIDYLRWVGAASAATLEVRDGNGVIIAESEANSNNFVDIIPINKQVDGLVVQTMSDGVLMIYLR